jgi:RNA polymerase sigma-70 factor, ECF subfamily
VDRAVVLFLDAVAEPERFADRDWISRRLHELLVAARAGRPDLPLDLTHFVPYLAARVPTGVPAAEALAIHAVDLLLAERCGAGDARALAIVERELLGEAPAYLARYAPTPERLADVLQVIRERLFVGPNAKIKDYAARGPLGGWLRATAVNTAITIGLREDRQRPSPLAGIEDELFTEGDPEQAILRERYGPAFRLAFEDALRTLTPEEGNYLRWSVVEGKSIDRIAAMVGVHRATVARRIDACRNKLYLATRDALAERVAGSATELDSMMAAVKSVVETGLRRFLAQ